MDDSHPLSVGAARSHALREADVVFLMGARLNWIMHFGLSPRFSKDVRVIQLDLHPEEIGTNVPTEVALPGDGRAVVSQLNGALGSRQWFYPDDTAWRSALAESAGKNQGSIAPMLADDSVPMNYYRALRDIREWMPDEAIIVSEGANTMDIGRTQLPNSKPRKRLDAGTYGTMGVGPRLRHRRRSGVPGPARWSRWEGDSGFGFSGMEVETICRLGLPIKTVVLNNGGIGASAGEAPNVDGVLPPGALTSGARYDLMMEAFGGRGFFVEDPGRSSQDARRVDGARRPDPRQRCHQPQGRAQATEVPLAHHLSPYRPELSDSPAPRRLGESGKRPQACTRLVFTGRQTMCFGLRKTDSGSEHRAQAAEAPPAREPVRRAGG